MFVGTTNPDGTGYLKDATGGRRFWPVRVGDVVDVEGLARGRDQLFAEAVRAFDDGEGWWPDRAFEAEHAAPEQEGRYEGDAWDERVRRYLAGESFFSFSHLWPDEAAAKEAPKPRERVTMLEVARDALDIEMPRLSPDAQRRIAKCLRREGWIQRHSGNERWWEPADAPEAAGTEEL